MNRKMRIAAARAAVAIVAIVGTLSACSSSGGEGGQASSDGGASQSSSSEKTSAADLTKVTVWTNSGSDSETLKSILESWGPKNGYDIEMEIQGGQQYRQGLQLALQTGKGPDVMQAVGGPALIAAGYFMPLNDVIGDDITKAYGSMLESPKPYNPGGTLFELPTQFNTVRLIINEDAFKAAGLDPSQPPETLGEILDDCAAIAKTDVSCFGLPLKWAGWVTWYADRIVAAGGPDLALQGAFNTRTGKFEMTKYAPVVTAFRTMLKKGWAYPGASSLDNDMLRSEFAQGKIAMAMSASWDVAELNDSLKTKVTWKAVNVPVPDGQTFVRNDGTVSGVWAINAKTKVKDAAAAVLQKIASAEVANKLAKIAVIPARPDVDLPTGQGQITEYFPTDTDTAAAVSPAALLQIQGETYVDALTRLVLGDDPIESSLSSLSDRYNAALESGVKAGQIDLSDYTTK